jgi:hypothetical protein
MKPSRLFFDEISGLSAKQMAQRFETGQFE